MDKTSKEELQDLINRHSKEGASNISAGTQLFAIIRNPKWLKRFPRETGGSTEPEEILVRGTVAQAWHVASCLCTGDIDDLYIVEGE